MDKEKLSIIDFCDECERKTRMRFAERKNEYLVYECTVCDAVNEFSDREVEEKAVEEMV